MVPSQSSSESLQLSLAAGLTPPWHSNLPSVQTSVPCTQAPTLVPHGPPSSIGVLSVLPSQSSSLSLQVSGFPKAVAELHSNVPLLHSIVPAVHSPVSVPQTSPTMSGSSSTVPSQSSSSALQNSLASGSTARTQARFPPA